MTYQEAIDYLYTRLPVFHRIGKKAFKADLKNTIALCAHLGNPERQWKSIHVGGTNGKGSVSHLLAAILQQAGYKTGLYTSPHLKSFTERIRVNGLPIPEIEVADFVEVNRDFIEQLEPSFFELSVGMAFDYFAKTGVEIAIIEVGLGGRLDSTNVISPELSVITNIGWDHTDILGDTLEKIAIEKAGIIKTNVPVVISERQTAVESVFVEKSVHEHAPIFFASDDFGVIENLQNNEDNLLKIKSKKNGAIDEYQLQLMGSYQKKNILGVLKAIEVLRTKGFKISDTAVKTGMAQVITLTGLKGRWQILQRKPFVVSDTAHNEPGIKETLAHLASLQYPKYAFVLGFVNDKDLSHILPLFPTSAKYYFCEPNIPRGLSAAKLAEMAQPFGLVGKVVKDVNDALGLAIMEANADEAIYIGGSTFVVAEIENL